MKYYIYLPLKKILILVISHIPTPNNHFSKIYLMKCEYLVYTLYVVDLISIS